MINNRIFGAPISDKVKEVLEKRQSETGEIQFGDSVKIPQTTELNSRTPFIRMWTGIKLIEPVNVEDGLIQLNAAGKVTRDEAGNPILGELPTGITEEDREHGGYLRKNSKGSNEYVRFTEINGNIYENYVTKEKLADITRNQINHARKIYTIGDYNKKQDYTTIKPNESTQETAETFFDTEASTNPLLKPLTGIKSVSSETEGSLGLTKTTTVQFTVHNFYDYDNIYNKYFLKPGARIFVDFGWSDIDNLYNPEDLLREAEQDKLGEFLYGEKDEGDEKDGIITKNAGNLEVINGIVKDYSSKMLPDGSVDCEVTLVSANSALLSFRNDEEVCKKIERKLDVGIYYLGVSRVINDLPEDSKEKEEFNRFLVPDENTSTESIEKFERNLRVNAKNIFSSRDISSVLAVETGLFVASYEVGDAYMSWGLFEDYIINNTFGHGPSTSEINEKFDSIRLDSTGEFTAWSKTIYGSHKQLFKNGKDEPDFLWPAWWSFARPSNHGRDNTGYYESYNLLKGKKLPSSAYGGQGNVDEFMADFDNDFALCDKRINGKGAEFGRIPIRECFIKVELIKKVFTDNKNKPIRKIIEELLKKISEVSSGLFSWKLIAGSTESQAKIVDINYTQNELIKQEALQKQSEGIEKFFRFKIMSPNSMVKDFNLEFKLPSNGIGDMYAIKGMSATDKIDSTDPGIKRLVNVEAIDDDNLKTIYLPDNGSFRATEKLNKEKDVESFDVYGAVDDLLSTDTYDLSANANYNFIKQPLYAGIKEGSYTPAPEEQISQKTDPVKFSNNQLQKNGYKVVNSVKEYYDVNMFQELKKDQIDLLPYTLDLTVYGISSIVPGDTFTVDYLPKAHLENTFLQVTKITQNVDSTGWYTGLQTQYRNFYPKKANLFNPATPQSDGMSRLSPSCLINEFKIKLGQDNKPRINDTYVTVRHSSDRDSQLNLKTFMKYMTNISIEQQDDNSEIDHILKFKTTNTLDEFIAAYDDWDGLVINHLVQKFFIATETNGADEAKSLTDKGMKAIKRGAGAQGDSKFQNMWSGKKPSLIYYNSTADGGKARFCLPSVLLEKNTWYRMWIKDGNVVILKPNDNRNGTKKQGWTSQDELLNQEDERYKKLQKTFQKQNWTLVKSIEVVG